MASQNDHQTGFFRKKREDPVSCFVIHRPAGLKLKFCSRQCKTLLLPAVRMTSTGAADDILIRNGVPGVSNPPEILGNRKSDVTIKHSSRNKKNFSFG